MGDLYATIYQTLGIDWNKDVHESDRPADEDRQFAGRQNRFAGERIAGVSLPDRIPSEPLRTHLPDGRLKAVLSSFDPLVQEWFERLGPPTEPQLRGWPVIRAGEDVLISAPTGSGKTLAAFLICIDGLIRARTHWRTARPTRRSSTCSPLKALSNDVHKNLERPLAEIRALAEKRGIALAPIRIGLRTGDTHSVGAPADAPRARRTSW